MKIIYLTNLPSPYRVEFFNELVRRGIDLTVIFERETASDREEKWKSTENIAFHTIYLKAQKIGGESSLSFDAIKYIKSLDYDLVIVHGYSTITAMIAIEYMRIKRIPFVLSADGGIIKEENKVIYNIKKHYIKSAIAWLSTGKKTTEYFEHYGAKNSAIYEYPFSSIKNKDIEEPKDENVKLSIKQELGIKSNKIVLYVGQCIHRKGIDVLIKAALRVEKAGGDIYLVGGKPDQEMENLIKKYELNNIFFVPFKTKNELKNYYRIADVFVLPTREDIWGLVVNEAMGYGIPVVSTNRCVAALTMITHNKSGYIVNVGDSDQLGEKIADLLNNEKKRSLFALSANETAKEYTIEKMASRHIKIFKNLLSRVSQKYGME